MGRTSSPLNPEAPPEAVVFPESTEEARAIVAMCGRRRAPMIPFGAGSSVEGQVLAIRGGVSIDSSRLNRILAIRPDDLDCTVQAGVTRRQLTEALRGTGLLFSLDPGADAAIGGMISTRASGTNAVRYGTMRENVIARTVVLAGGRVIRTGSRAQKSSAGYDLTRLFTGAEGTLGIITEATVRSHPAPAAIAAAVCSFASIEGAARTVIGALRAGVPLARSEALRGLTMSAINRHSGTTYREQPTLFLEFHGSEADCMTETAAEIAAASMPIPMFGHAGDGNFHCVIPVLPDRPAELAEAKALTARLIARALAMDGACTGEHGVGIGKLDALRDELGEAVDVMAAIKRALDPDGLMNPGKVVDPRA